METIDKSLIDGLQREKNEEVGKDFKIKIYPKFSFNLLFRKKAGNAMVLPHYLAVHLKGKIELNEEYLEYQWVSINDLPKFEPKIPSISETVKELLRLNAIAKPNEFLTL